MLDVLAYLFEQYYSPDECPDRATLARRLLAAGFEDAEVDEAMEWLGEMEHLDDAPYRDLVTSTSPRLLHPHEADCLTAEAQAFFYYLASTDALSVAQREMLIDRLMSNPARKIDLESIKRLALMILWRQGDDLANLLIDELLYAEAQPLMH
ncbi:DUF494 domain-containing protein [Burkholderiaceae bacterium DAT-1]|nr:DUF494 domain-containing protein [Burkholderiaceae bacterium DAT-1]